MGAARRWSVGSALVVLVVASLCPACDDARAIEADELCPPAACDGGDCGPPAQPDCTTVKHGDDAGSPSVPVPTDLIVPPCSVCVRVERCCKAAGLTDCHYTKACVSAPPAAQPYYIARCQAVIDVLDSDDKTLPDVCSF